MDFSFTDIVTAFKTIADELPPPTDVAIRVDVEVANLHVNPLSPRWTLATGNMAKAQVITLEHPLTSDQHVPTDHIDASTFAIDKGIGADTLWLLMCYQIGDDVNAGFVIGCALNFNDRSASKFVLLCDPQLHLIDKPGSATGISEADYWMLFQTQANWPVIGAIIPSKRGGSVAMGTYTQGEDESATITHGKTLVRQHAAWRIETFLMPKEGNNYVLRAIVSDKGAAIPSAVMTTP